MKNTHINIVFGLIAMLSFSILPNVSYAVGKITVINNNYNNNVPSAAYTYTAPPTSTYQATQYYTPTYYTPTYYKPTHTSSQKKKGGCTHKHGCGVKMAYTKINKPTCSLVPAIIASGAVELQWTTNGATVAFIDTGIGHVTVGGGSRIVTPTEDIAYNLTVLNDAGIAGTCGARINVSMANSGTLDITIIGDDPDTPDVPDDPVDPGTDDPDSSLFDSVFSAVAIPIGIVFFILIVLLVIIMSRVNAAK